MLLWIRRLWNCLDSAGIVAPVLGSLIGIYTCGGDINRSSVSVVEHSVISRWRSSWFDYDTGKAGTAIESITPNTCDTLRDDDAAQVGTARESSVSDTCHTLRDDDAAQAGTAPESILPNTCHALRDIDAVQAGTARESKLLNTCHALRNDYAA